MTRDELLAALEITPEDIEDIDDDTPPPARAAGPPPSTTALELDAWSIRRGAEALDGEVLGPILEHQDDREQAEATAADCLAAAFEPAPRLADRCVEETRGRYFAQLLETPEYQALHTETQLDPLASELAAGHFAQGYTALVQQERTPDGLDGPGMSADEKRRQDMKKEMQALGAASTALRSATKTIDDLRDAQRALGEGGQDGGGTMPLTEVRERFERIKNNRMLRRIMAMAGRYRRAAQAQQRQKTRHGQDDVIGVTLGADLGALVPSELAALVDEDLELDTLRRFLERSLIQREYRGVEPKAQGPIVFVGDESGSMRGTPAETMKAIALSMAWVARHQRRWILMVGFANDSEGSWCAMPPDRWDQAALLDWLEHFYGGGTSPGVPFETLPARWNDLGCPAGKTDVILVTDARMSVPDDMSARYVNWKSANLVKHYTLVLGQDDPGDLAAMSDRVWTLPDLGIDQDAIQEILAL